MAQLRTHRLLDEREKIERFGPRPSTIRCQEGERSCAQCCGINNFIDRSTKAKALRLHKRTLAVLKAGENVKKLVQTKHELMRDEKDTILCQSIRVCPFAGWLDAKLDHNHDLVHATSNPMARRVGCLIHPSRFSDRRELRDLSVHDAIICDGFFCAAHMWIKEHHHWVIQLFPVADYSRFLHNISVLDSLIQLIEYCLGRPIRKSDHESVAPKLAPFIDALSMTLAHREPSHFGIVQLKRNGDEVRRQEPEFNDEDRMLRKILWTLGYTQQTIDVEMPWSATECFGDSQVQSENPWFNLKQSFLELISERV